ncbi:sucrose-6-phosphate hydrolase [Halobacillus sp. GSS1]|uniref:glycoside hydrolase family 32 protein n=1 Tax=Halobacillus sp. GSS1 TaxID=2815919 RepID=UPI001A8E21E7|nr:sucrose-6-phosphate hydrolase [Halobacillus sp. GSS1]MBN9653484.1 sucrose-6-phosphate hydrolase [Halobacillus sp. GSS1]
MITAIDFTNRQNRYLRLTDVSEQYLRHIEKKAKEDPYYPTYHVAPRHGLLNDPNGLSYYKGRHHIFYQWFPLGPVHGLKHWYHVSTKDFVHYEDHGIALYPDHCYDSHGCYSGSGVVEGDSLHLFYTGNHLTGDGEVVQSQVHAVMDPDNFIRKAQVIANGSPIAFTHNFRDPVVFEREGSYYMLVGGEMMTNEGGLALYKGESMDQMTYEGTVSTPLGKLGYMWECPNYFEVEEQGIFIFSPQGDLKTDKYNFNNVFSVAYMIGEPMDLERRHFEVEDYIELDKGFDFYAPQTYVDDQGRRILIGWLGNSKSEYPTDPNMWAHMLTIPRTLEVKGNELIQSPVEELVNLRKDKETLKTLHRLHSQAFEMRIMVEEVFEITFENDKGECVTFSSNGEEYELDRSKMTHVYAEKFGTKRYAKRKCLTSHRVMIYIDRSSIEIFCDDGATVFTSRMFVSNLEKVRSVGVSGDLYHLSSAEFLESN